MKRRSFLSLLLAGPLLAQAQDTDGDGMTDRARAASWFSVFLHDNGERRRGASPYS